MRPGDECRYPARGRLILGELREGLSRIDICNCGCDQLLEPLETLLNQDRLPLERKRTRTRFSFWEKVALAGQLSLRAPVMPRTSARAASINTVTSASPALSERSSTEGATALSR
jgi:hypothetical protein